MHINFYFKFLKKVYIHILLINLIYFLIDIKEKIANIVKNIMYVFSFI